MITENFDTTNFNGRLIPIGRFSDKPNQCISSVKKNIEKQINSKCFNLYIKQDYSSNEVRFACKRFYPFDKPKEEILQVSVPTTSKSSRYIDATKDAINLYEKDLIAREQKEWEQRYKQYKMEHSMNIFEIALCSPLLLINKILYSINPKWSNKFEKLIDKILK